jgi:hypothetical protein
MCGAVMFWNVLEKAYIFYIGVMTEYGKIEGVFYGYAL